MKREKGKRGGGGGAKGKYPTDDVFMVTQMRFAVLAAVDLMTVQVNIVRETHRSEICASALLSCPLLVLDFAGRMSSWLACCNRGVMT